jgi:peptidase E
MQSTSHDEIARQINPKLKILAIGGGSPSGNVRQLIKSAYELFGVLPKSRVLLLPTAKSTQGEATAWLNEVSTLFAELGYQPIVLHDFNTFRDTKALLGDIAASDAIYIAGGDTLQMMETWAKLGIVDALRKKALSGVPIGGISAGAIASMKLGHSDSLSFRVDEGEPWEYISVSGLDLVPFFITPHYDTKRDFDGKKRSRLFKQMVEKGAGKLAGELPGGGDAQGAGRGGREKGAGAGGGNPEFIFGIDNFAGIVINEGDIKVYSTNENAKVHRLFWQGKRLATEKIRPDVVLPNVKAP